MEQHLKYMKDISDKLAAIGAPISEEDQVVTLLGSLPKNYATLITALEARVDDVKLDFVLQALMHEEMKQTDITQPKGGDEAALVGTPKKKPLTCYKCKQVGHIRRNCPQNQKKPFKHRAKAAENHSQQEQDSDSSADGAFTASVGSSDKESSKWIIDSGASSHMTHNKDILMNYKEFAVPENVALGDSSVVKALGSGTVSLMMFLDGNKMKKGTLRNVLYVPKLTCNLFSVRAAVAMRNVMEFTNEYCLIKDRHNIMRGMGSLGGKLFLLRCEVVSGNFASLASADNGDLWHQRLAHVNEQRLKTFVSKKIILGINIGTISKLSFCEGCLKGKMSRKPFPTVSEIRSKRRLELVHSDLCGPMHTKSIGGARFFVTFVDDYTRCCSVYFMKQKSEVFDKFKEFEARASNDSGERIGTLRTDNGGEYTSNEFEDYLKKKGIRKEMTVPYSPQQNGVAERMNRTLVESARSMIAHANLPNTFWADAVHTAAYVRNILLTAAVKENKTPFECWYGRKPNISHIRVFGCMAYAHISTDRRRKLDPKATKMRFVGYSLTSKGYRLYDEESKKLFVRRDVVFNENDFDFKGKLMTHETSEKKEHEFFEVSSDGVTGVPERVLLEENANVEFGEQETNPELRRSERTRKQPVRFGFEEFSGQSSEVCNHCAYNIVEIDEPQNMKEAMESEHSKEWKAASDSEYDSLIENETWKLVELPPGRKAIGCKWIFKVKHCMDGTVERFKARLVAKGYSQKYGIDYDETFSPVVRFSSVRTLLAFGVKRGMLIHQMDVVTAFLNGTLDEEIYMQQPEGYIKPGSEHLVCKLERSLYGLKQSPRCWNKAFHNYLVKIGFKQTTADPCVYVREGNTLTIVAVYVDDLIILAENDDEMKSIKADLTKKFKMKDMGELHYCLGINILQDKKNKQIVLNQRQYIEKIIKKFGQEDAKTVCTPADVNVKLQQDDGVSKKVDSIQYQSLIGSLLYAAIATRPDIAQAVGVAAKYCKSPTEAHLTAAKRILKYLKGTSSVGIRFEESGNENLIGFSDANWAGDLDDRHSTSGFMLVNGPIS